MNHAGVPGTAYVMTNRFTALRRNQPTTNSTSLSLRRYCVQSMSIAYIRVADMRGVLLNLGPFGYLFLP